MLKKHPSFPGIEGPILTVIMDGIGLNVSPVGNAVLHANTPTLDRLARDYPYTTLLAHGKAVGMPSDACKPCLLYTSDAADDFAVV